MPKETSSREADIDLFAEEPERRRKVRDVFQRFVQLGSSGAIVLLIAAIVALIIANSAFGVRFTHFWETDITLGFGAALGHLTLGEVVNDVLMAFFFLVVGTEIKRELLVGELADIRKAILPILAAAGGMVMPAIIYAIINSFPGGYPHGWGVPMATDIAFAIGIMAILGSRAPSGLKVFLTAFAIADDLGAIVVIALFYGQAPNYLWLGAAALVVVAMIFLNRLHVDPVPVYLLCGAVLLVCCFYAGIHPTIAGVITAFCLPSHSRVNPVTFTRWARRRIENIQDSYAPDDPILKNEELASEAENLHKMSRYVMAPLTRVENMFLMFSTYFVLPVFALSNAGIRLVGDTLSAVVTNHAAIGVFFGLLIGKPLGVLLFSFIAVRLGISKLPYGVRWGQMAGAGILGGLGFTMSIFVANLAFAGDTEVTNIVKAAVLCASLCSGILGYIVLSIASRKRTAVEPQKEAA